MEQKAGDLNEISSLHEAYLAPILKWRIMDIVSLKNELGFKRNYSAFCRSLRGLEDKGVIGSYRRPNGGKKVVYLTSRGEKLLAQDQNPTAVSKETLVHDLKVSELTRELLNAGLIQSASLEHEIHNKRQFGSVARVVPDALWEVVHGKKALKIALELELNLKSRPRIIEKIRQYLADSSYDSVIYFFEKKTHFESYRQLIEAEEGEKTFKKIALFWRANGQMLTEAEGLLKGKPALFMEQFRS